MRLIDADALLAGIEEIMKSPWYNRGKTGHGEDIGFMHAAYLERKEAVEVIRDLCIKNAPTVGGWVSVKDRLPDHSCTVLTYHDYGGMQVLDYSMKHKLFNCHDWNKKAELDSIKIESVTHWQPLPEPPKEVDENGV